MGANNLEQFTGDALIKELFKGVASKDDISLIYTKIEGINTKIEGINTKIEGINTKMEKIISENRARHYDMQNISLQNHGISLSGHVSSSQAAGRSPRIKLNSYDTYH